jgi:poly-gamma-glutamate capsule biosynthesis protein CapA/YwtB (metallophosphatase superfamily)
MLRLIRAAAVRFVNLEVSLSDYQGIPAAETSGVHATASPKLADELQQAGFNLFALANNHMLDYGQEGLALTLEALKERNITYAGAGYNLAEACTPGYLETPAGRVALIACSSSFPPGYRAGEQRRDMQGRPGINPLRFETTYHLPAPLLKSLEDINMAFGLENPYQDGKDEQGSVDFLDYRFIKSERAQIITEPQASDLDRIIQAIHEAEQQADIVLVSIHAHEWSTDIDLPALFFSNAAYAMIDAGADAIIGHGPHMLRGIEIYKGAPIFYSLGNFVFQNETFLRLPSDAYELFQVSSTGTPLDIYNKRDGYRKFQAMWESVIAAWEYEHGHLSKLYLYPLTLGFGDRRSKRGRPVLAESTAAEDILRRLQKLSHPYGTNILIQDGIGTVTIDEKSNL